MRVISRKILEDFWRRFPDAEDPLRDWYKTALSASWRNLVDARRVYRHADSVEIRGGGILTIFNIGGNKYRLIVRIRYEWGLINVRCVLTHAEYDKDKWKERG